MTIGFGGGPEPADGFPVPRSAPAVSHLDMPATDRRALGQALGLARRLDVLDRERVAAVLAALLEVGD